MPPGPVLAVGAIARHGGSLLLVRRATEPGRGQWSLPGGRVELGETVGQALEREVREETGLEVRCDDLVGWVERISSAHHFVILDFDVTPIGVHDPVAGSDAADARWVQTSELGGLDLVDGLLEFLVQHGVIDQP